MCGLLFLSDDVYITITAKCQLFFISSSVVDFF